MASATVKSSKSVPNGRVVAKEAVSTSRVSGGLAVPRAIVPKSNPKAAGQIAVVLVRGFVDMPEPILRTLTMLRLRRKNFCVVIPNTPENHGMVVKVKDWVTWGEITPETFTELIRVRGEAFLSRKTDSKEIYSYKSLHINGKDYKPYFRLNPPRKGFGRKGIKVAFAAGGSLGYRASKMDDLVKRML